MKKLSLALLSALILIGCGKETVMGPTGPTGATGPRGIDGLPGQLPDLTKLPEVSVGAMLYDADGMKIGRFLGVPSAAAVLLSNNDFLIINLATGGLSFAPISITPSGVQLSLVECHYESGDCSGNCHLNLPLLPKSAFALADGRMYQYKGTEQKKPNFQSRSKILSSDRICVSQEATVTDLEEGMEIEFYEIEGEYLPPQGITLPLKTPLVIAQ